jgi:hypothetical protein
MLVSPLPFLLILPVLFPGLAEAQTGAQYRGKYIGPITAQKHKVSGEVFAVDSRTLHIRGFTYDGTGPDAFFWTGFTEQPGPEGVIIPNERGTKEVLGAYNNQDITISLPDGLTLRDIKWFAIWCRAYEVNFGDLYIPANLDFPQPHVIGSIVGQHGVSSGPIVVVDAQTILVPDFTYDGKAPDLHFWVGRGVPGPSGFRVPDETGSDAPLVKADKKTMVLSLPGDLTVFDIDYFGVWCRLYSIDFGHVRISPGLNVPPSLQMLGISPQVVAPSALYHHQPQPHQPLQIIQPQSAVLHHHAPAVTTVPAAPLPLQPQYIMILEPQPQHQDIAVEAEAPQQPLIIQQPHQAVQYQASLPLQNGVVYSAPLTSATTTTVSAPQPNQHQLGANGFSTYTIRTSKGSSTSDVLY